MHSQCQILFLKCLQSRAHDFLSLCNKMMSSCALAAIYSFFSRELFLDPLSVAICTHYNFSFHHSLLAPSLPSHSPMVQVFLPASPLPPQQWCKCFFPYPPSHSPMVQMMPVFRTTLGWLLVSSRQRCSRCVLASWASI